MPTWKQFNWFIPPLHIISLSNWMHITACKKTMIVTKRSFYTIRILELYLSFFNKAGMQKILNWVLTWNFHWIVYTVELQHADAYIFFKILKYFIILCSYNLLHNWVKFIYYWKSWVQHTLLFSSRYCLR